MSGEQLATILFLQMIAIPLGFWLGWVLGGLLFDR